MAEMIRALSMWQPWASLWLTERKIHETRDWPTKIRGRLIVHASQRLVSDCGPALDEICIEAFGPLWRQTLPRGALLGEVEIIDCWPMNAPKISVSASDLICGNWQPDRYAIRRGPYYRHYKSTIPWRGRQRFFFVPADKVPT